MFGVDARGARALAPSVKAINDALRTCEKKALTKRLAFPFVYRRIFLTKDGMREDVKTFKDAAAAATACRNKQLKAVAKLPLQSVTVTLQDSGVVGLSADDNSAVTFELVFDHDRWRLRAAFDG